MPIVQLKHIQVSVVQTVSFYPPIVRLHLLKLVFVSFLPICFDSIKLVFFSVNDNNDHLMQWYTHTRARMHRHTDTVRRAYVW